MSTTSTAPMRIHGVSLNTRAGKPKSRYSNEERLQILGATRKDLQDFMELFCPGQPHYAITRAHSSNPRDWTTPKGRVGDTEILNHLLGNLLPGKNPRWVAPRCWEITRWVGIDVDLRNEDYADFFRRCKKVRSALRILGVGDKHLLVSNTPSGGKHYRFFLTSKIRIWEIENVFRTVGIEECAGKFELFPRKNKGMRLPFGYQPGKIFQPQEWLKFIHRYQAGKIPNVRWDICKLKAERYAALNESLTCKNTSNNENHLSQRTGTMDSTPTKKHALGFGLPKWKKLQASVGLKDSGSEYTRLLSKPATAFTAADAKRIWELGICSLGTRVQATKKVAWHLCHVLRLTLADVIQRLVDWVYQTGAHTSHDVQQDIATKTRRVEQQTKQIVVWTANHPPSKHSQTENHSLLSEAEVDHLLTKLQLVDSGIRQELLCFALNFLRYAKLHGQTTSEGWEASITANKVMRKWPGCGGSNYKQRRDLLEKIGLIQITQKEWKTKHRGGRARTYLIKVSPAMSTGATMTHPEALCYAEKRRANEPSTETKVTSKSVTIDSYKRVEETTQPEWEMVGEYQKNPSELDTLKNKGTSNTNHGLKHVLRNPSNNHSSVADMIEKLKKGYHATAKEFLRFPNQNMPQQENSFVNVSQNSPEDAAPLDLRRLRELDLSQRTLDYLSSRPANCGIPKAIRQELETVQALASWSHPPP